MTGHHEVIVVGAGISGIGAVIRLQRMGIGDVVILEKAHALGGTWRDNTYPGCACDVPSALYSYSFAPNPGWSRLFAGQHEIREYIERTAAEHGVHERVEFGTELLRAQWDEPTRRWVLETSNGTFTANALIAAAGPWNQPLVPDIPGLDGFAGEVFHSSRWNHDYDLSGKRVAVVGTGASAVQFVPEIAPVVGGTAPVPADRPVGTAQARHHAARSGPGGDRSGARGAERVAAHPVRDHGGSRGRLP